MSEALTDWFIALIAFVLLWFTGFLPQRSGRLRSQAVPVPRWLAWISGFPRTQRVDAGSFGWQFLAVCSILVFTGIVLAVPEHRDRIVGLMIAFCLLMIITICFVEWLRRCRRNR